MIDEKILEDCLKKEGYPEFMINQTINKIENMNQGLKQDFEIWLNTGKVTVTSIEGYTIDSLVNKYNMKYAGAFITLDWLLREPEAAKKALLRGIK